MSDLQPRHMFPGKHTQECRFFTRNRLPFHRIADNRQSSDFSSFINGFVVDEFPEISLVLFTLRFGMVIERNRDELATQKKIGDTRLRRNA